MAGSYVLPQVRVFQEFAETPNDVTQNLNPFVIGPNYQLMRYSSADERVDCTKGDYAGAALTLKWAKGVDGSKVDTSYFKVTLTDAYAKLGDPGTAKCLDAGDGVEFGTKFEFTHAAGKSLTGADSEKLILGAAVKAGDYLGYTSGGKTVYTKILKISMGTPGDETAEVTATESTGTFKVGVAEYTGEKPVTVKLTVKDGKMTWASSISGISSSSAQVIIKGTAIGLGLGLTVTPMDVKDGKYVVTVKVADSYDSDTVTVADLVPAKTTAFAIYRRIDSVELDDSQLTVTGDGVVIDASATVKIGSNDCQVAQAKAYLTQRNFTTEYTDGVYSVSSDSDVIEKLGAISPDNPLAYAAHVMLLNCSSVAIRFIAVESDDYEGYAKALDRASVTTDVYAFCPLTEDRTIIDAVVAHCKNMSTAEEKSWRIAFFSMPTEGETDVTPTDADGVALKCTVKDNVLTCTGATFSTTVRSGDSVTVVNSTGTAIATTVDVVQSNTTLKLVDNVASATTASAFTITHKLGQAEYVAAIAATSEGFKDRRAYNVFPNRLRNSDGEYVSGMYGAAAVCALACSVAPQQPITNVEIKGFTDLPDVYSKYNKEELNTIAAGGTLILMQDKIGGSVYVRHQISTAYSDGNLNTTELSLTKNLDSISYYFANRFAPYIGRYNVTDDLLTELKGVLLDGLTYLETSTETNRLVGPQVLADGTEITSVYRSDEKDKVYADVALSLPAPFNNFDLRLQVI